MDSLRSLLFVPADNEHKLEKSRTTSADALILDLEDSVTVERKPAARVLAAEFLEQKRGDKKIFVRVNPFDSGMTLDDLSGVMSARPDGIMLPKCGGAEDAVRLEHWLEAFEAVFSLGRGSTLIVPIVTETPAATLRLASYVGCSRRVWGLLWGAEDLAGSIGAAANRTQDGTYRSPFRWARDQCLIAAAAAQVVAIDAAYTDIGNVAGLRSETEESRIEGFTAKAAIHPSHCEVINAAFAHTDEEVNWARRVIAALSQKGTIGVATLDGKMIDKPHELQAQRILASSAQRSSE